MVTPTQGIIDAAIGKARATPGKEALKWVAPAEPNQGDCSLRPLMTPASSLSFIYNSEALEPVLWCHKPPILKHQYFPPPPLMAYKQQKQHIRESHIKEKVYPQNTRDKRYIIGMNKCGKYFICNYIKEGKFILEHRLSWKIVKSLSCDSFNVVYVLDCHDKKR